MDRRDFLKLLGVSALTVTNAQFLTGCITGKKKNLPFQPLRPSRADKLILADGLQYDYLVGWQDPLTAKDYFGYNCDFTCFVPMKGKENEGLLWVNHESVSPIFVSGIQRYQNRTKEQAAIEQYNVGGSIVHIRKSSESKWEYIKNSRYNRRLNAFTKIPFAGGKTVLDKRVAVGTFANCAGGFTPWGNVLTCEENFHYYFGKGDRYSWGEHFPYPIEHYGWVVEIEPFTGNAKKLTGLGRFAHECAFVVQAADGRCVAYSGDDKNDEHVYKFIADKPGTLETGTLYAADVETGRWLPLTLDNPKLKTRFKDHMDLLIHTREAAKLAGATPLDRPEDIDQDPFTKSILVACTHNEEEKRYHGYILALEEKNQDPLALEFKASKFLEGGPDAGFSSPDNFAIDRKGNLWMTVDMSEDKIGKGVYAGFGNNALFYIPLHGEHRGTAFQIASAPVDSELTGPAFSPDGRTLFLSVQHPGSQTTDVKNPTSRWPDYSDRPPRPSVVTIHGPLLDKLIL